jgi:tetratricopeptide (TPR) repeat protein
MSRGLKIFFLLLLVNSPLLAQNETLIVSGNEKLQKKNYDGAWTDFQKVLEKDAKNIQAICGSALVKSGQGNTKDAMTLLESAADINPQSDYTAYVKGEILLGMKDYTGAISSYNKAIELNPLWIQSYIGKSKAYNIMGNTKEAFKVLDEAIDKYITNAELLIARGMLNNNKERYSKAIDDFDKAISLNDKANAFAAYFNRGVAFSNLQEYESALTDLNKAAELDSTNANAYHSLGLVNYQMGNFEVAVKHFNRSNELNPNNAVTYYNLGMAYYKMENIDNACIYFHKSCSMNNTNSCKMIIMVCSDKKIK